MISGNSLAGVGLIGGSSGNTVQGNYIGATPNGLFSIGNRGEGVEIDDSPNNLIGGTDGVTPGEGCNGACNLICGNNQEGLAIDGTGAVENRVSGNYIGTDQAGTADLGNGFDGILIADDPNYTYNSPSWDPWGNALVFQQFNLRGQYKPEISFWQSGMTEPTVIAEGILPQWLP